MRVDDAWLGEHKACADQRQTFNREWPDGVEVTRENLRRAAALNLNLDWFAPRVLSRSARKAYETAVASALKTYEAAVASALKTYEAAVADAGETYEAAVASAWKAWADAGEAYETAVASAWKAWAAAVAPAREAYAAAVAPAREAYTAARADALADALGLPAEVTHEGLREHWR